MSPLLSVPLTMISMIAMVPMVVPMAAVIPMVVSIMVLIERKCVKERFLQARLILTFNNLCQLLKLLKLVKLHAGRLCTPGLVGGQHVVDWVEVEEDGGVVLRVRLPLLPHLLRVLLLQQLLGLAGHEGGSGEHQAWEEGREKCHLDISISLSLVKSFTGNIGGGGDQLLAAAAAC